MGLLDSLPCFKKSYGPGPSNPNVDPPPAVSGAWSILHSPGHAEAPGMIGGGWQIDFLKLPSGHLHYVTQKIDRALTSKLAIEFHISASADVKFGDPHRVWPGQGLAPNFRFMIQRRGDNLSMDKAHYRYWSNPTHFVLKSTDGQVVRMEASIPALEWSNVSGGHASSSPSEFMATCQQCENAGITFGAGNSFGHGAGLDDGSARITMTKFEAL